MGGWGCIQAGVLLFQSQFWTGVLLLFEWGEVLFKSGVAFARIRYVVLVFLLNRTALYLVLNSPYFDMTEGLKSIPLFARNVYVLGNSI